MKHQSLRLNSLITKQVWKTIFLILMTYEMHIKLWILLWIGLVSCNWFIFIVQNRRFQSSKDFKVMANLLTIIECKAFSWIWKFRILRNWIWNHDLMILMNFKITINRFETISGFELKKSTVNPSFQRFTICVPWTNSTVFAIKKWKLL